MKALIFNGKESISYESIDDPTLESDQDVIVKVEVCAICGSDLHPYHEHEKGLDHGTVMGHEFVGEIVETGKAVRQLQKGDWVVSPFTTNCGQCYYCRIGLTCRCEQGQLYGWRSQEHGLHGGQAEYVRVPLADSTLVKINPEGNMAELLMAGDIFSTGYFAVVQSAAGPRDHLGIIGAGPVGLMAAYAARERQIEHITILEKDEGRIEKARSLGFLVIDASQKMPVKEVHHLTQGRGFDSVVEAVGHPSASRLAVDVARPGATIASVGVHTTEHFSFSPVELYDKNLTFKSGRCPARFFMDKLLPVIDSGKYPLSKIITHQMPLSAGPEAYTIFDQKLDQSLKIVLHP